MRATARTIAGLLLGLAALACERPTTAVASRAPADEESGPLRGWHYVVTLDDALTAARVDVCFEGRPPELLVPGAPEHTRWVEEIRDGAGRPIAKTRRGADLRGLAPGECVEMNVDLTALAPEGGGGRVAQRRGDSVLARASAWLWRPASMPSGADVTLRFEMPEGHQVSVPWPTVDDAPRGASATYRLDSTAFRWLAYAVWGRINVLRTEHVGAQLEVATLDQEITCTDAGLLAWVRDASETVAPLFGGRFPREHLQVVVVPVEGRGGDVYFGLAARGGGAGIFILMDDQAHARQLPGGWTTVHEMLHHGMPFIQEPWMAEGWVTYYTELVRARSGRRTEAEAWTRLADGFSRGERGGRGMSMEETSDAMRSTFAYQRVYWGGAAIAFMLDLAVREDSGGKVTLDDAMVELRRCCGDSPKRWPAADLLAHLDQWYGKPLFTEVVAKHLAAITFPPAAEALEALGVRMGMDGEVHLDDAHPGAAKRRAIMAPQSAASR